MAKAHAGSNPATRIMEIPLGKVKPGELVLFRAKGLNVSFDTTKFVWDACGKYVKDIYPNGVILKPVSDGTSKYVSDRFITLDEKYTICGMSSYKGTKL